jgi:tetratricopeptide (TPR) repeat protein
MTATFADALGPLVQQIEAHVYSNPPRAIDAARQLLKQCGEPAQVAYVYEQLGFAHLVLGEHRLSCLFYEQARAFDPRNMYVLANLAHAQFELGDKEAATRTGKDALQLKDEDACRNAEPTLALLEPHHRGARNIISFSLYGDKPRYCEMAVLNVLAAQKHLPEFDCRFYMDASVPPAVIQRLENLGAQCIRMDAYAKQMPATFWRFLAMDDTKADCVLVRDVDALIDAKEAWCVQDWRASDLPFHVIRDDCCHTELILAGLFGIRAGTVREIEARIANFLQKSGAAGWARFGDQLFLRSSVWPWVRAHTLTHDSVYGFGAQLHPVAYVAQANEGPRNAFIGANHGTGEMACDLDALPANTLPYVTLRTASGALVCRYRMHSNTPSNQPARWSMQLPQMYVPMLESGRWQYEISLFADGQVLQGEGSSDAAVLGFA